MDLSVKFEEILCVDSNLIPMYGVSIILLLFEKTGRKVFGGGRVG